MYYLRLSYILCTIGTSNKSRLESRMTSELYPSGSFVTHSNGMVSAVNLPNYSDAKMDKNLDHDTLMLTTLPILADDSRPPTSQQELTPLPYLSLPENTKPRNSGPYSSFFSPEAKNSGTHPSASGTHPSASGTREGSRSPSRSTPRGTRHSRASRFRVLKRAKRSSQSRMSRQSNSRVSFGNMASVAPEYANHPLREQVTAAYAESQPGLSTAISKAQREHELAEREKKKRELAKAGPVTTMSRVFNLLSCECFRGCCKCCEETAANKIAKSVARMEKKRAREIRKREEEIDREVKSRTTTRLKSALVRIKHDIGAQGVYRKRGKREGNEDETNIEYVA
eukprot:282189-Amorphochlora_amoeboformis.AAC.1